MARIPDKLLRDIRQFMDSTRGASDAENAMRDKFVYAINLTAQYDEETTVAMAKNTYSGYYITRNYTKATVYHFSSLNKNRLMTETLTPDKSLSREERYNKIAELLVERFGFAPCYRETRREKLSRKDYSCHKCNVGCWVANRKEPPASCLGGKNKKPKWIESGAKTNGQT